MATRNIVPNNDGEGGIGTPLKKWLNGYFNTITGSLQNTPAGNITSTTQQAVNNELDQRKYNNLIINSGFLVNNGNAGVPYVSGVALTAGQYGHEGWKAGASGCTYTFTQSGGAITGITITAGSLIHPIESLNIIGGSYVLSWTGTATARLNSGSYGSSPLTVAGITVGTQLNVEFGLGTLSKPKINEGLLASPYYTEDVSYVIKKCQRYCNIEQIGVIGSAYTASAYIGSYIPFKATMRAVPTITVVSVVENTNVSVMNYNFITTQGMRAHGTAATAGGCAFTAIYMIQARL